MNCSKATAAKLRVNGRRIRKCGLNIVTVRFDCNTSLEVQEEEQANGHDEERPPPEEKQAGDIS